MDDNEKKKQREAVRKAVSTAGNVYLSEDMDELKQQDISENDAKAAVRHLVQIGLLVFDDEMKLIVPSVKKNG